MSNVISFQKAKAKKDSIEKTVEISQSNLKQPQLKDNKTTAVNDKKDFLFLQEAKKFKLINMKKTFMFVIMNTDILPQEFPPNNPPPLVA